MQTHQMISRAAPETPAVMEAPHEKVHVSSKDAPEAWQRPPTLQQTELRQAHVLAQAAEVTPRHKDAMGIPQYVLAAAQNIPDFMAQMLPATVLIAAIILRIVIGTAGTKGKSIMLQLCA
jgi:hypothetical protein